MRRTHNRENIGRRSIEIEIENYNLRIDNEFLRQERDELRVRVKALAEEVADLKDGQYAAMEQKATELEQRCEELAASRDFWKSKAEERLIALEKSVEVNKEMCFRAVKEYQDVATIQVLNTQLTDINTALTKRVQRLEEVLKGRSSKRNLISTGFGPVQERRVPALDYGEKEEV